MAVYVEMSKPKVLVVEDDPNRVQWFMDKFDKIAELFITMIPEIAVDYLDKNEPDLIFLDHDLGDEVYVDSSSNTGDAVAQALQFLGNKGGNVVIHTLNPIGAVNMKARLPLAHVIPFRRLCTEPKLEVLIHWLLNKRIGEK